MLASSPRKSQLHRAESSWQPQLVQGAKLYSPPLLHQRELCATIHHDVIHSRHHLLLFTFQCVFLSLLFISSFMEIKTMAKKVKTLKKEVKIAKAKVEKQTQKLGKLKKALKKAKK